MDETFGQRLQRLRLEHGLTPGALAMQVGVTEGAIRQMEYGRTKSASFTVGTRLADALGVSPHYLATGNEAPRPLVRAPQGLRCEWRGSDLHLSLEPGAAIVPDGFIERVVERATAEVLRSLGQLGQLGGKSAPHSPEAIGQALVAAGNLTEAVDGLRNRLEALEGRPRRRSGRR